MKIIFNDTKMDITDWMIWAASLGYHAMSQIAQNRRYIYLITTPDVSPLPLFTLLGAIRKDLESPDSDDISDHFERLKNNRTEVVLHRRGRIRLFFEKYDDQQQRIWYRQEENSGSRHQDPYRVCITKGACDQYHFINEPPIAISHADSPLVFPDFLDSFILQIENKIHEENLYKSHSRICYAGSPRGEKASKRYAKSISIEYGDYGDSLDLARLLMIDEWNESRVSRTLYYNSRTGNFDRPCRNPDIVIAEDEGAFIRIVSERFFSFSDIIAFIPSTMKREVSLMVRECIGSILQWYDLSKSQYILDPPNGINYYELVRKNYE